MAKGIVNWFDETKGYGLIKQEDGSDVFFHHTSIQGDGFKSLAEGDTVIYDIEGNSKGPNAVNVIKV